MIEAMLSPSAGSALQDVFDIDRLKIFRAELVRGSREVEAGLFFRIAVFGLWLESLKAE